MMPDLGSLSPLAGYAGIAAVAAAAGAFWSQIRGALKGSMTWFLVSAALDEQTGRALLWHLRQSSYEPLRGRMEYGSHHSYIRKLRLWGHVALESAAKGKVLLHRGWVPVVMSSDGSQSESSPKEASEKKGDGHSFRVSSLRWAFDMEAAIAAAMDAHARMKSERQRMARHYVVRIGASSKDDKMTDTGPSSMAPGEIRYIGHSADDLGLPIPERPFAHLAYPDEVLRAVEICRRWLKSKDWYGERSIQWRLGMLLEGMPGTGKTSFARAIAQSLDLPVIIMDLSELNNTSLVRAWARARESAPAMVLLEDMDRVSMAMSDEAVARRRRPPRDPGVGPEDHATMERFWQPLTLDCLLNCLSGIEPSEGILTVATANDASKLDSALSRPGRLDFRVHFPALDEAARRKIATNVLALDPPSGVEEHRRVHDMIEAVVAEGEGETGAQFMKRVADAALRDYWDGAAA